MVQRFEIEANNIPFFSNLKCAQLYQGTIAHAGFLGIVTYVKFLINVRACSFQTSTETVFQKDSPA